MTRFWCPLCAASYTDAGDAQAHLELQHRMTATWLRKRLGSAPLEIGQPCWYYVRAGSGEVLDEWVPGIVSAWISVNGAPAYEVIADSGGPRWGWPWMVRYRGAGVGPPARVRRVRDEEGQTMVLFALLLPFLLTFVLFIIVHGLALAERRQMQNAADAGALAGAGALCWAWGDAEAYARRFAGENRAEDAEVTVTGWAVRVVARATVPATLFPALDVAAAATALCGCDDGRGVALPGGPCPDGGANAVSLTE